MVWDYRTTIAFHQGRIRDNIVINTLMKCDRNNLKQIDLSDCQLISKDSLKVLKHFQNLTCLNLSGCSKLSDDAFSSLQNLPLKTLYLADCSIGDFVLKYISTITSLTQLDLFCNNSISNEGLKPLGALSNLRNLSLAWCLKISDSGLQYLSSLINLEVIDLIYCKNITNVGLKSLRSHVNLKSVRIHGYKNNFSDDGLEIISGMQNLVKLELPDFVNITERGISCLSLLTNLSYISLERCGITDQCLNNLNKLNSLKTLLLVKCRDISENGLKFISTNTSVVQLNLDTCRGVNDGSLKYIGQMVQLIDLNLSNNPITDEGLKSIQTLTNLKKLSLERIVSGQITDNGLAYVNNTTIEQLNISFCTKISDVGLYHVGKQLPNLTNLIVSNCHLITDLGLQNVRNLPLKFIDIKYCCGISSFGISNLLEHKPFINLRTTNSMFQERRPTLSHMKYY